MTVRDLGYRAYEGELNPPSQNFWVMVRHGMWRIWGSWLNRFVLIFFWLPAAVLIFMAWVRFTQVGPELPPLPDDASGLGAWFMSPPGVWLRTLTGIQFWFFATLVTIRSGAGVISSDLNNRAYQFYFAKPLTPIQYLTGRAGALAIWIFGLIFVPCAALALVFVGVGTEEARLERFGLLLPAFFDAAMIAITMSTLSVATSALSRSRALTLTAWSLLLFVPFILAFLIQGIANVDWAFVISIPGVLWSVGDALYKVSGDWEQLKWFHGAPILVVAVGAAVYGAIHRIGRAEVIA